jgi:hypothetical protein
MRLRHVVELARWFMRSPRLGARYLSGMTEVVRATEFSRQAMTPGSEWSPTSSSDAGPGGAENPLWVYFNTREEGRGIWKWTHYFEIYQKHLAKFVGRDVHVVEIGVCSGGSLKMWRHYFGPRCHVTGVDIEEACRAYEDEHTSISIGDQADREFWRSFRERAPTIDVLIDDGGHTCEQQRVTLEEMLPHIRPGGVYLCEDVHGVGRRFAAYTHALADQLNDFSAIPASESNGQLASGATSFQKTIHSIHFYPYVVVIEKAERPIGGFVAPKRGTEWQPFP